MKFHQSSLPRHYAIGWLGLFIVSLFFAAAINFGYVFLETMEASHASGTHVIDGFEITYCYFGPPAAFYPRLVVFVSLLVASIGLFQRTFPRSGLTLLGLTGAGLAYVYWWADSYRVFTNFEEAGISFMNNFEVRQVAYLYNGTSFDIAIALSSIVSLVLLLDRGLFPKEKMNHDPEYVSNDETRQQRQQWNETF